MITKESKRNLSLDFLRILACLMVICIHVSTREGWYSLPSGSFSWLTMHFFDFICRPAVPIFFMISGALFLSKQEISIKNIYLKNILRLLAVYFIFIIFYYFVSYNQFNLTLFFNYLVSPKFHLWYIPAMIGVYVFIPVLKKIAEDRKILKYVLLVFIIFSIILSTFEEFSTIKSFFVFRFLDGFNLNFLNYAGYFLLGYYLETLDTKKYKKKYLILFFALVYLIFSIFSAYYMNLNSTFPKISIFYSYFSISTFLEATLLYVLFKNINFEKVGQKITNIIMTISGCTLGIYLIHIFILEEFLNLTNINLNYNSFLKIPLITGFVFIVSLTIIFLIKKLPILKKLL